MASSGGRAPGSGSSGRADDPVPGSLFTPPGTGPLPGWVVLHGITRPGRRHAALRQFASALASTGARVLVPEIREWQELDLAPERAQTILRESVTWMAGAPETEGSRVMLVGFSFGGPQALLAASDPSVAHRLKGVLAWGSYADLERTLRFQFTGEHAYQGDGFPSHRGIRYQEDPDPYGRWVVAANCLRHVPEVGDAGDVAQALRDLAARAGDLQIPANDLSLEPLRLEMRKRVHLGRRELFDLFAPPLTTPGRSVPAPALREGALELVAAMARGTRRAAPLLDPLSHIEGIGVPVRLLHGKGDVLIPFTETLELADRLRPRAPDLKVGITGLFAHSGGSGSPPGLGHRTREGLHFLRVLRRVFEVG
jgi:pimeloyl-ACP methyl ester carboxylesterase